MNTSARSESALGASFIVPVDDRQLYRKLEANLEQFAGVQRIPIEGATSFFDAWRQGLKLAKEEHIVFTHQDVLFNSFPALASLFKDSVGLVGVAGSKVITRDHPWWAEFDLPRLLQGSSSGSIYHGWYGKLGVPSIFGRRGKVTVLDGVCLVTPTATLENVGIPNEDQDWANWHFYDHILSLRYRERGYDLMTVPINMFHASTGDSSSATFKQIRERFVNEYFSKTDKYSVR